jgi:hypothetical protein
MGEKEIIPFIHQSTREAIRVADAFGAAEAVSAIPLPPEEGQEAQEIVAEAAPAEIIEADAAVQLQILRELMTLVPSQPDVGTVIALVLEGMYRGVGMERVVFSLLTPDRKTLVGKSAIGGKTDDLLTNFSIPVSSPRANLFAALVDSKQSCWLPDRVPLAAQAAPLGELTFVTEDGPFFASPAVVDGKCIGLFYADRRVTGKELDQESYDAFCHFAMVAGTTIELLKR